MISACRSRGRPFRRPLLVLLCAVLCLGCEELLNALLYGPELCAEGFVRDEKQEPVASAAVALTWHCEGTECTSTDCSECEGLGSEHVVTDSMGYYEVVDRVLDADCSCDDCRWDVRAEAPGYRQVEEEILGRPDCSGCEVRNFTLRQVE